MLQKYYLSSFICILNTIITIIFNYIFVLKNEYSDIMNLKYCTDILCLYSNKWHKLKLYFVQREVSHEPTKIGPV